MFESVKGIPFRINNLRQGLLDDVDISIAFEHLLQ